MGVLGVKKLIGVSLTCLTCVLHMQTCVRHRNEITLSDNLFKIEKHSVTPMVIFSKCLTCVGTIKPCFSYSLTIWTTYGRKLLQETTKMINIIRQYASTSGKSTSIVGLCLLLNTAFIISHLELTTCISVDILEFILKYPEKEVDFDVCFQI